jgi:FKBP-type peptidyl-prolyl cis-trans isomerase 2
MLKEGDFIEIDYTGKLKEENFVFDTTVESVAKQAGLDNKDYRPVVICLGQGNVLAGLDKKLVGKEAGKEYDILLQPEEAFGKKNAALIQLMSTSKFRKDKVDPMPGMQVNIDGNIGIVKTVTGGRTLVDFNHPLSSKEVTYHVSIKRLITDDLEKAKEYLKMFIGDKQDTKLENGKLTVEIAAKMPAEIQKLIGDKLKNVVPAIKEIEFKEPAQEPAQAKTEDKV